MASIDMHRPPTVKRKTLYQYQWQLYDPTVEFPKQFPQGTHNFGDTHQERLRERAAYYKDKCVDCEKQFDEDKEYKRRRICPKCLYGVCQHCLENHRPGIMWVNNKCFPSTQRMVQIRDYNITENDLAERFEDAYHELKGSTITSEKSSPSDDADLAAEKTSVAESAPKGKAKAKAMKANKKPAMRTSNAKKKPAMKTSKAKKKPAMKTSKAKKKPAMKTSKAKSAPKGKAKAKEKALKDYNPYSELPPLRAKAPPSDRFQLPGPRHRTSGAETHDPTRVERGVNDWRKSWPVTQRSPFCKCPHSVCICRTRVFDNEVLPCRCKNTPCTCNADMLKPMADSDSD